MDKHWLKRSSMKRGAIRALYTARIGESYSLAENVPYDTLLKCIVKYTVRAALAKSIDENDWEQEQLRRNGLATLQLFRNGKAIWRDTTSFEAELFGARRQHGEASFEKSNALDPALYDRIDRDLLALWRLGGYEVSSLRIDMKKLFIELERDASDRAESAREGLLCEILTALFPHAS